MKIHILTDNRVKKRGFLAEHGLSIFIEHNGVNILFDTGQTDVYCHNAKQMNIDLNKTDLIVLSHGHYDHCGGLLHFPNKTKLPNIYIHNLAFEKRYALNADRKTYRDIGIPYSCNDYDNIKNSLVLTNNNTSISSNITLCSEIPSTTDFEKLSEDLCVGDDKNKFIDKMQDEQMLIFNTEKGLCIFLGCSHPGIINCLNYVGEQFPGEKIHTLVAGMHLNNVSSLRLQKTIDHIINLDIQKVIPLHCTGILAISEIKRLLGDRCLPLCAGDSIEIL